MKSLSELQQIRGKLKSHMGTRENSANDIKVVVGMATCGIAAGARNVTAAFLSEIEKKDVKNVKVTQSGCINKCKLEPVVEVFMPGKEKVTYVQMTEQKAREVVASHLLLGKPVAEYMSK